MAEFRPASCGAGGASCDRASRRRPADRERRARRSTAAARDFEAVRRAVNAPISARRRRRRRRAAALPAGAPPPAARGERLPRSRSRTSPGRLRLRGRRGRRGRSRRSGPSRHEDWSEFQSMSDLVLTPAACYPVYPAIAARGRARRRGASPSTPAAPTCSATSPPAIRRGCRCSTSARSSGSASRTTVAEWRELWRDRAIELLARPRPRRRASTSPPTPSSGAAGG